DPVQASGGEVLVQASSASGEAIPDAALLAPTDDDSTHSGGASHVTAGPDSVWSNDDTATAEADQNASGVRSVTGEIAFDASFAGGPWHSSGEVFVAANANGLFHDSSIGNYASINNGGYGASYASTDSDVGPVPQVPIVAAGSLGVSTTAPVVLAL